MNFVKVYPGILLNMAAIREVREHGDGGSVLIRTDTGGELFADRSDWDQARQAAASQIIPAAPGTFHIFLLRRGEDKIEVGRDVVIAWLINLEETRPITLDKVLDWRTDQPSIELPDGCVYSLDGVYRSSQIWFAEKSKDDQELSTPDSAVH